VLWEEKDVEYMLEKGFIRHTVSHMDVVRVGENKR
jgi:hypothetical protein